MEHPCPNDWQYEQHPKRKKLLARTADVLARLRSKQLDGLKTARDSRPIHLEFFKDLTPSHFAYFAGHYRGEPYRCLDTYACGIPGDKRVGAPASEVLSKMSNLSDGIVQLVSAADAAMASATLSEQDKLIHAVGVACMVFDTFLQVHPYANGNGHAARVITWAILGRYGYWPTRWTVEPRPKDPPYTKLLLQHRAGDTKPLVEHVISCIK